MGHWTATGRGGEHPRRVGGGREPSSVRPARVVETLVWPVDEDEVGVPFAGVAVRQGVAGSAVAPGLR